MTLSRCGVLTSYLLIVIILHVVFNVVNGPKLGIYAVMSLPGRVKFSAHVDWRVTLSDLIVLHYTSKHAVFWGSWGSDFLLLGAEVRPGLVLDDYKLGKNVDDTSEGERVPHAWNALVLLESEVDGIAEPEDPVAGERN